MAENGAPVLKSVIEGDWGRIWWFEES